MAATGLEAASALSPAPKIRTGGDLWSKAVAVGLPGPEALSPCAIWCGIRRSTELTPGIATTAMQIAAADKRARSTPELGGISKAEASEALFGILSTLHERKKKRVHTAASPHVAALEAKVLNKQARAASKKIKRAVSAPQALLRRTRDVFGNPL